MNVNFSGGKIIRKNTELLLRATEVVVLNVKSQKTKRRYVFHPQNVGKMWQCSLRESTLTEHHAMEAYWGSGGIVLLIHALGKDSNETK
jgi:hypothetical protein